MTAKTEIFDIGLTDTAVVSGAADKKTVTQALMVRNEGSYLPDEFAVNSTDRPPHIGTRFYGSNNQDEQFSTSVTKNLTDTLSIVIFMDGGCYNRCSYMQAVQYDAANKCTYSGEPVLFYVGQDDSIPALDCIVKASDTMFVAPDYMTDSGLVSYSVDPVTLVIKEVGKVAAPPGYNFGNPWAGMFHGAYVSDGLCLAHIYASTSAVYEIAVPTTGDPTLTLVHSLAASNLYGRVVRANDAAGAAAEFAHMYAASATDYRYVRFTYDTANRQMSTTTYEQLTVTEMNQTGYYWCLFELREDAGYGWGFAYNTSTSPYQSGAYIWSDNSGLASPKITLHSSTNTGFRLSCVQCGPGMAVLRTYGSNGGAGYVRHRLTRNGTSADAIGFTELSTDFDVIGFKDAALGSRNLCSTLDHVLTKTAGSVDSAGVFLNMGLHDPNRAKYVPSLGSWIVAKNNGVYVLNSSLVCTASVANSSTAYPFRALDLIPDEADFIYVTTCGSPQLYTTQQSTSYLEKIRIPTGVGASYSREWQVSLRYGTNYYTNGFTAQPVAFSGGRWAVGMYGRYSSTYQYVVLAGTGDDWTNTYNSDYSELAPGTPRIGTCAIAKAGPADVCYSFFYTTSNYRRITVVKDLDFTSTSTGVTATNLLYRGVASSQTGPTYSRAYSDGARTIVYDETGAVFFPNIAGSPDNRATLSRGTSNSNYNFAAFFQGSTAYYAHANSPNGFYLDKAAGATWEQEASETFVDGKHYRTMFGFPTKGYNYYRPYGSDYYRLFSVIPGPVNVNLKITGNSKAKTFDLVTNQSVAVGEVFTLDSKTIVAPGEELRLNASAAGAIRAAVTLLEAK